MITLASRGVNPSNTMVANGTRFPNYAGRDDVDAQLIKELADAGIGYISMNMFREQSGEVVTSVRGELKIDPGMPRLVWGFTRLWYYWSAEGYGAGIPLEYARKLQATHGEVVRVGGYAGGRDPGDWNRGFAIDKYHVDTAEGLKALADTIKQVNADFRSSQS
jgi:hypothetical protein